MTSRQHAPQLIGRGVEVSEVFHFDSNLLRVAGTKGRVPGPDPEGRSYSHSPHSDPTVTAGSSSRSRRGFLDEGSARTS